MSRLPRDTSHSPTDGCIRFHVQPHGSDLQDVFGAPGTGNLQDYLIRFAATLNPNGDGAVEWPQYTNEAPNLLTLNSGDPAVNITKDVFRAEAMAYLTGLSVADPM